MRKYEMINEGKVGGKMLLYYVFLSVFVVDVSNA